MPGVILKSLLPVNGVLVMGGTVPAVQNFKVRYFISYAHGDEHLKEELIGKLRTLFASMHYYQFEYWQDNEIPLSADWHDRIQAAVDASDVGLLLVSPAFLASDYIRERELPKFRRVVPVALCHLQRNDMVELLGLEPAQMNLLEGVAYSQLRTSQGRDDFVSSLFHRIIDTLNAKPPIVSESAPIPAPAEPAPQVPPGRSLQPKRRSSVPRAKPAPPTIGSVPDRPSVGKQIPDRDCPPGTVFRDLDEPWCPAMVVLPSGRYLMGSPKDEPGRRSNEDPQHEVVFSYHLAIGRTPVTFAEYDYFCAEAGVKKLIEWGWGRDQRPVVTVSWRDANRYARWLSGQTGQSYRLPSEAEWEYACRAGSTGRWCFGDDEQQLGQYAWFRDNSGGKTHPIGHKRPNEFGLFDVHGNVWEWVGDQWHWDYHGAPTDGSAWDSGDDTLRPLRGGSWFYGSGSARAADRYYLTPDIRNYNIGFRVARTLSLES